MKAYSRTGVLLFPMNFVERASDFEDDFVLIYICQMHSRVRSLLERLHGKAPNTS